jgi:hypothetical protein
MTRRISIAKLEEAAASRRPGYLEDVWRVATKVSDTHLEMPEHHFQRIRAKYAPNPGPGTELKAMLATMGIHASPTCKCNKMARQMDEWGPEEAMKHIEEIVDVMEETAQKRGLPFIRTAGRALVRMACWKAKRRN